MIREGGGTFDRTIHDASRGGHVSLWSVCMTGHTAVPSWCMPLLIEDSPSPESCRIASLDVTLALER